VRSSALVILFATLTLSCRSATAPGGMLLIVVDALRADHLACYGYDRPTSPHIDALAADATRFAKVVSHSPWTLPSLATLMPPLERAPRPIPDAEVRHLLALYDRGVGYTNLWIGKLLEGLKERGLFCVTARARFRRAPLCARVLLGSCSAAQSCVPDEA
jgi:hypothetical protein